MVALNMYIGDGDYSNPRLGYYISVILHLYAKGALPYHAHIFISPKYIYMPQYMISSSGLYTLNIIEAPINGFVYFSKTKEYLNIAWAESTREARKSQNYIQTIPGVTPYIVINVGDSDPKDNLSVYTGRGKEKVEGDNKVYVHNSVTKPVIVTSTSISQPLQDIPPVVVPNVGDYIQHLKTISKIMGQKIEVENISDPYNNPHPLLISQSRLEKLMQAYTSYSSKMELLLSRR